MRVDAIGSSKLAWKRRQFVGLEPPYLFIANRSKSDTWLVVPATTWQHLTNTSGRARQLWCCTPNPVLVSGLSVSSFESELLRKPTNTKPFVLRNIKTIAWSRSRSDEPLPRAPRRPGSCPWGPRNWASSEHSIGHIPRFWVSSPMLSSVFFSNPCHSHYCKFNCVDRHPSETTYKQHDAVFGIKIPWQPPYLRQARRAPPDGPGDVQRLDVPCLVGAPSFGTGRCTISWELFAGIYNI